MFLLSAISWGWSGDGSIPAEQTIFVRLYNPARVNEKELARATAHVDRIFSQAGIRVKWSFCVGGYPLPEGDPCLDTGDPATLSLGLTNAAPRQAKLNSLGYTETLPLGRWRGAVLYERVEELAHRYQPMASQAAILAMVMAHEMGHMLLASTTHSNRGVMRANWSIEDVRLIGQRRLVFSREEASAMRTRLLPIRNGH
jgi:hypothetical protein